MTEELAKNLVGYQAFPTPVDIEFLFIGDITYKFTNVVGMLIDDNGNVTLTKSDENFAYIPHGYFLLDVTQ